MNDDQRHHHRGTRRSSTSGRSSSRRSSGGPRRPSWHGFAFKGAIAAVVSLAVILFITQHFSSDTVATDATDPTWPWDGGAADLGRAAAALESTPPAIDEAEDAAKDALGTSPLSVAALDMLAQAAQAAGDQEAVARYRNLIMTRTLRSFPTLRWRYDEALRRRDFATMMPIGDALLRQDFMRGDARYIIGTMAALAADPDARPELLAILARPSAWRRPFLNALAQIGPIDTFPDIMAEVPPDPDAPTTAAWNFYFDRLTRQGQSRQAYVIWSGQLPEAELARLGLLYNGGFETKPSGAMFDWTITPAKGMEIVFDNENPGEGTTSLRVAFGGAPMSFQNVRQTLILDPGVYTLSGLVRTEDLQTERGLSWAIYCYSVGGGQLLASSPSFSGTTDWSRFSVDFEVPPFACDYQAIRLELPARIAAERRIQGRIWVDGLSIVPKPQSVAPDSTGTGG